MAVAIDSLFILNDSGSFVVEKHFRLPKTQREVCEAFRNLLKVTNDLTSLPDVIITKHETPIFQINRNHLVYLATSPLGTLELLLRIYSVIERYCGYPSEEAVRNNFSTIYLLLDEMIDSGTPSTCEINILEMLVPAPSVFDRAVQLVSGPSSFLSDIARSMGLTSPSNQSHRSESPTGMGISPVSSFGGEGMGLGSGSGTGGGLSGCGSDVWWRKGGISYTGNEVYVDVIESLNCIVDKAGDMVCSSVTGSIQVNSKLSGVPQLTLTLRQPSMLEEAGLHPCVKLKRFERDRALSFIPPDGVTEIASYHIPSLDTQTIAPPVKLAASIDWSKQDVASIQLRVRPQVPVGLGGSPSQVEAEGVTVVMPLPNFISSATLTTSTGIVRFIQKSKLLVWDLGKLYLDAGGEYIAEGTLNSSCAATSLEAIAPTECSLVAHLTFCVKSWTVTNIKVDSLEIHGVSYTPYKGVRSSTIAGKFEYRL
eukprot:GHVN01027418.1.p1 GENE.GHVN01027418.1~~GHVN01027418.1.p1  ORF type:complete len:535 (+),score=122.97 GHVN01027418.1:163-1605(+)